MLNALFVTTLPTYLGSGQTPNNAGLHTQWLGSTPCVKKTRHQTLAHNFPQILSDFQNSFAGRLSGKFATNSYLNIPSHLKYVGTLPREI